MTGFTAIPNHVMRDRSLPLGAKMLYGVILSYAYGPAGRCTAGTETLCDDAGIKRSTFFASLALLDEKGLIRVEKRKSPNGWRNVYTPLARAVENPDHTEEEPEGRPELGLGVVQNLDGGSSTTRTQNKTKREEQPEPDGSGDARKALPVVRFRGKPVHPTYVRRAVEALRVYREAVGRRGPSAFDGQGKPTPALKQVIGAVLARPDVKFAEWERAITRFVAAPPSWVEGQVKLGQVFGERAAEWALAAAGDATADPSVVGHPVGRAASVAANYALIEQMEAAERGGAIVDAEVVRR